MFQGVVRDLADYLIKEAVWSDVPDQDAADLKQIRVSGSGTIQTNVAELQRADEGRVYAVIADDNSATAVCGFGESAPRRIAGSAGSTSCC